MRALIKFPVSTAVALALWFSSTQVVEAADLKVLLQGGQSNALGRAPTSGLATSPFNFQLPQDDVLFFYGSSLTTLRPGSGRSATEFGPEITFGRGIADASPAVDYAIIKYAAGGTALYNDWAPGTGAEYTTFRNTVTAGLAALQAAGHTTEIVGMIWHQGENDAIEGQQANYASNLSAFIADVRSHYGTNLPFLIGEIRRSNGPAFVTVADAQIAVAAADAYAKFVPASDLTFLDTYHFDAASQTILGERFATAFADLMNDKGDTTPPTLASSDIVDDQSPDPILANSSPITYTITFSEDIDDTSVSAADFANAGSSTITIGTINETDPGIFTVLVTPTSAGTLQLQLPASALILDVAGNLLVANPPIIDDSIITVTSTPGPWITGVSIEDFSSSFSNGLRPPENIINGSGFTEATGFHSNAMGDNINWINNFTTNPLPTFITIDLGGVYDLNSVKIWNWNTSTTLSAGVRDLAISVASDVGASFTALGGFVLNQAPGATNIDFGQVIDLSSFPSTSATRLVRFDITSSYGFGPQSLAGLSEVRFSGTPVNDFATYISNPAFGLNSTDFGFDLDPDDDQISNGLEAFFGTNPGQPNSNLIGVGFSGGNITTFTHPQNQAPVSDIIGSYEWSLNLIDWYAGDGIDGPISGLTVNISSSNAGPTTTNTVNVSSVVEKLFVRVVVNLNQAIKR